MAHNVKKFIAITNCSINHFIKSLNIHQDITFYPNIYQRHESNLSIPINSNLFSDPDLNFIDILNDLYDSSPTRICGTEFFLDHSRRLPDAVLRDHEIKKIFFYKPLFTKIHKPAALAKDRSFQGCLRNLVFIHIPKTAGLSLHHVLKQYFDKTMSIRFGNEKDRAFFLNLPGSELTKYKYITGHISLKEIHSKNIFYPSVAILRDPVDRLISLFRYYRKSELTDHKRFNFDSFELFLKYMSTTGQLNMQCWHFSSTHKFRDAVKIIRRNRVYVAPLELYDDFLGVLSQVLDFQLENVHMNVTPKGGSIEITDSVRALLQPLINEDLMLIRYVRENYENLKDAFIENVKNGALNSPHSSITNSLMKCSKNYLDVEKPKNFDYFQTRDSEFNKIQTYNSKAEYNRMFKVLNETNQSYLSIDFKNFTNENQMISRILNFLGLSKYKDRTITDQMLCVSSKNQITKTIDNNDSHLNSNLNQNAGKNSNISIINHSHSRRNMIRKKIYARNNNTLIFVDYTTPQYDKFAGSRTNFMYLSLLAKMGFQIKFLPADFRRIEPYSTELNNLKIETLDGNWFKANWENWLFENGREVDFVFFNKPDPTMKFLSAFQSYTNATIIYQCHDLHYLRLEREAKIKNEKKLLADVAHYKKIENYIFSKSDVILTFSSMEETIIKNLFPNKKVYTVPLFFYEKNKPQIFNFHNRKGLLFVGSFAHTPNQDAVFWFCKEVLPLVRSQIPDIIFFVVGSTPPQKLRDLESKLSRISGWKNNVRFLGNISDKELTKIYESVRLAVVPLRYGAGVKGKTMEALYHGVPVVSTSIGVEGIKGINHVIQPQDEPSGFASEIISLYKNEEKLKDLGERGRNFIHENFTSDKTAELMDNIFSFARNDSIVQTYKYNLNSKLKAKPRLIAFYLPQYHPIPENDKWWGKGFTEWRNVTKAKAWFPDHYQPHIPADLGFYDLRVEETRIAQAQMAKTYGIYGFCYYHYWFNGKRLLERPLEDILRSGRPDFPFCLCWANENWTRRWDGEEHLILMKMTYSQDDDRRHIRALFKIFEDYRYIRINGKPLFMVYRTENLPEPARTADIWREEARKAGIGELYLCRVESIGQCDPRAINFDAAVEFAPDWNNKGPRVRVKNDKFANIENNMKIDGRPIDFGVPDLFFEQNYVHYYDTLAKNMLNKPVPDYKWFRCVTPSWDNTARRQEGAHVFVGSTPEKYQRWLEHIIQDANSRLCGEEKVVFINAWNEWGEGNHLEPDQKFGRAYLEKTLQAIKETTYSQPCSNLGYLKKKTLYLHIGFSRTGTTALQQFLGKNRETLLDKGFLYPQTFSHDNFCHHKLYWFLDPKNVSKDIKKLVSGESLDRNYNLLMKEFDRSGAHSLVMSSELFSNHDFTSSLKKLRAFFDKFEIKIIVYLRKQDDFLLSMYNQVVKRNLYTGTFTECFNSWKQLINNIDYADFLFSLENVFGRDKIIVKIYERNQFFGGSIYTDFLNCFELSDKIGTFNIPPGKLNSSLRHDMIEIKRFANSLKLDDDAHNKLIQLLKKDGNIPVKKTISNHKNKEKWEKLIKKWEISNKTVANRYFPSKANLFQEPLEIENLSLYLGSNQDDIERFKQALSPLTDEQLVQLYEVFSKSSKNKNCQRLNLIKKIITDKKDYNRL